MADEEVRKEQAVEEMTQEDYFNQARFDGPIAGQSLMEDPSNPRPDEKPPVFTALKPALEYTWSKLIEQENYVRLMNLIANEVPILTLSKGITFVGVRDGKWNPDMMMLLIEPVAYMLIALAERQNIPMVIYEGEEEDEEAEEEVMGTSIEQARLDELKSNAEASRVPEGILSAQMQADLEAIPTSGSFDADELNSSSTGKQNSTVEGTIPEPETAEPQESLMARQ